MENTEQDKLNVRLSNIELLRIISMIIIVAHHFAVHSDFDYSYDEISINRLWVQFIQIGGKIGVDVFVLISGYFMISKSGIKMSKIVKLWSQVSFYSLGFFCLFTCTQIEPFGIKELIKHAAPITFGQWWFASTYFMLYLLSPYINILLNSFEKEQYLEFLALLFALWCIIPTITGRLFQSNDLLWFVFLYSLAGFIRLFNINIDFSGTALLVLSFIITIMTFSFTIVLDLIGISNSFIAQQATFLYGQEKAPILLISILLFMGFLKYNIPQNRLINTISSATFGVYLIHDNGYVRPFLWKTLFNNSSLSKSHYFIPYSIIVIITVFACCTIIELLRVILIQERLNMGIKWIANRIDYARKALSDMLFNLLSD